MFMRSVLALAGIAFLAGCSGDGGGPSTPPPPPPTSATVTTATSPPPRFVPQRTRLAVGGTVTWRNTSPPGVVHNVAWAAAAFPASQDLEVGDTHQIAFPQAGTFDYMCLIHSGMVGRIVVE